MPCLGIISCNLLYNFPVAWGDVGKGEPKPRRTWFSWASLQALHSHWRGESLACGQFCVQKLHFWSFRVWPKNRIPGKNAKREWTKPVVPRSLPWHKASSWRVEGSAFNRESPFHNIFNLFTIKFERPFLHRCVCINFLFIGRTCACIHIDLRSYILQSFWYCIEDPQEWWPNVWKTLTILLPKAFRVMLNKHESWQFCKRFGYLGRGIMVRGAGSCTRLSLSRDKFVPKDRGYTRI